MPLARVFWLGAAGIVVLAALVGVGAVVGGDFSDTDARILLTLAALLFGGGTGLAGLALSDRGPARALGRLVAVAAPIGLGLILWAIWGFVDEGDNEPQAKLGWTAVITLIACLIATTGLLLARRESLVKLAAVAGGLAGLAMVLSDVGIWTGESDSSFLKAIAVLWILAAVAYFLVPIIGRFVSAATEQPSVRVLAELDGVELVATPSADGLDVRLAPGERLQLRRRV